MTAKINSGTEVTIPLRNLISIVIAVVIATSAYFGILTRLEGIERDMLKDQINIDMNSEFRVKWPRGELGALPADARQDMLIESLERQIEELKERPSSAQPDVDRLTVRLDAWTERIVRLEEGARENDN
jgi:hypothetical protein